MTPFWSGFIAGVLTTYGVSALIAVVFSLTAFRKTGARRNRAEMRQAGAGVLPTCPGSARMS